ncbi:Two-component system response regulator protein [hydrothermal vent metagenome]|uniref:Two-component system response regulator protein n=1 Tax=hydrothermal vent metagenome TaxID=652676 RepID=A0A3B0ZSS8_9ZZZZ
MKNKLLIVEDDLGLQKQLKWALADDFEVFIAGDRTEAMKAMKAYAPGVVTLDLGLPPDASGVTEGFETLSMIREIASNTKVIMLTSNDDKENALRAIKLGAYDYCQKPFDDDALKFIIQRAINLYELEEENRQLSENSRGSPLDGVIATSPQMIDVCKMVERVAPTDVTTLVSGESGTGKELIARALHYLSDRAKSRFVAINCAAIPENLLESELFGYEKGAFTGASKQTIGKIEYANQGTLFLDEIGDLPQSLQAKLLRFLQERIVERLGGRKEIPVDVRVVCATHQDLKLKMEQGTFREDLYYRISEIVIDIPSLKQRSGDAVVIARVFLDRYAKKMKRPIKYFAKEAITAIESYAWPGNVRELENKIKRAVILEDSDTISAKALELEVKTELPGLDSINLKQAREVLEKQLLARALSQFGGNISQAAEELGVSRPTLYSMMKKYALEPR